MTTLVERLMNIVEQVDNENMYIPPVLEAFLRSHGFIPHRTYLRPPRPPIVVRPPCPAVTQAGTPCKNKCSPGSTTCGIHSLIPTPRGTPDNYRRCPVIIGSGEQCKCAKYKEFPLCWRHAKRDNLLPPPPEVPTECSICYSDLSRETTTKTSCGHYFHIDCFESWRQSRRSTFRAVTCPMCRHTNPNPKPLVKPPRTIIAVDTVHQS